VTKPAPAKTLVNFFAIGIATKKLRAGPARTPGTITLAPYVAWGLTTEPIALTPWRATPGSRVTLGLGAEWLGLLRLEAGYGVQTRQIRVAFDITRDFWDIL